jgi:hypothetical protein
MNALLLPPAHLPFGVALSLLPAAICGMVEG